ncbi:unnamed protein product [Symbiodinium necroappetens]|uniref:Uncharacterized protein n=1 Tax=Symbiodinium necroappetens TaxID=1628268 RepID=A0A812K6N1_9DINO|nr:unnamed protein product [Symbiodinium necroappetens]
MSLHADGDDRGLTEDVAKELCQCFRKSWELSLGDLGQSCREAVAASCGQRKLSDEALTTEVCSWRQAEVQLQSMAKAVEGGQMPGASVEKLVRSWLDASVEEVERRTTDARDGQLFNERFLASFPVQGDAGLEQAVAAELQGHAKLLGTILKSEVPLQTKRACKKQLGATIQGGCEVLSEAVVEAVLEAAAALSEGRCVEASRRLWTAPAVEAAPLAKEVPKALHLLFWLWCGAVPASVRFAQKALQASESMKARERNTSCSITFRELREASESGSTGLFAIKPARSARQVRAFVCYAGKHCSSQKT